jgi:hypothetical protein
MASKLIEQPASKVPATAMIRCIFERVFSEKIAQQDLQRSRKDTSSMRDFAFLFISVPTLTLPRYFEDWICVRCVLMLCPLQNAKAVSLFVVRKKTIEFSAKHFVKA